MTIPLTSWLILIGLLPLSMALTRLMIRLGPKWGLVDMPSERRIHVKPIPRAGGVAVFATLVTGLLLLTLNHHPFSARIAGSWLTHFFCAAGILFIIGQIDDRRGMSAWIKLGGQTLAAAVMFMHDRTGVGIIMGYEVPWFIDAGVHIFWTVALINAFNLIDGMDGLCAGLGIISLAIVGVFTIVIANTADAFLVGVMIMALAGFLRYNFHPAKIFLGDTGSMLIGFFIATIGTSVAGKSTVVAGVLLPLLVGGVPLLDVGLAVWRRGARRFAASKPGQAAVKVFGPDKDHLHHRMLQWGFSQRQVAFIIYGLAILISVLAMIPILGGANLVTISLIGLMMIGLVGLRYIAPVEVMASGHGLRALIRRPRSSRMMTLAYFLYDLFAIAAASALAYWLILKLMREEFEPNAALFACVIFTACALVSLRFVHGHTRRWSRASVRDFSECLVWYACGIGISFGLQSLTQSDFSFRGAVFHLTAGALGIVLILIPRSLVFVLQESVIDTMHRKRRLKSKKSQHTTVLYGAGDLGELFVSHLRLTQPDTWEKDHIIGFIDDNPGLSGRRMGGFKVMGALSDIPDLVKTHGISSIMITSSTLSPAQEAELVYWVDRLELDLRSWRPDLDPEPLVIVPATPLASQIKQAAEKRVRAEDSIGLDGSTA